MEIISSLVENKARLSGGKGLNAHSSEGLAHKPLFRVAGFSGRNSQVFPERDAGCPLKALSLFPLGKWGRGHRLCSHLHGLWAYSI